MSNSISRTLNKCINYVHTRLAQPCYLCGARSHGQLLCADCIADLPTPPAALCPVCALPTPAGEICGACLKRPPAFVRTRAVYLYEFPVSTLIQQLKYGGDLILAPWLADRLARELTGDERPDLILPMPLHENRLRQRGFNQAALIAGRLAGRLGTTVDFAACRRLRDTRPQVELPLKARHGNIRKAFECSADLSGLRVALVDDVMTSGASLDELAKTVRAAGAAEVSAWVVARTAGA